MNLWIYQKKKIDSIDHKSFYGFVYLITNNVNGKKYIGKKILNFTRKIPPLKGKKRKRTVIKESDWKNYWGSSDQLKSDLETYGEENFTREIIHLCKTKTAWTYLEVAEQFERNVLFSYLDSGEREYYNDNISGKFYPKQETLTDINEHYEI